MSASISPAQPGGSGVAPRWLLVLELACVAALGAHLLFGPRDTRLELVVYGVLTVGVLAMGARGFLPPAPTPRPACGIYAALAACSLVTIAGMVTYGVTHDVVPTPELVVRTAAVYLVYAYLQQALTQRYLVVRAHAWLGRPAAWRTAVAVGLLFGALHLPWPILIGPAIAGGVGSSYAFLRSGRVWPLALAHAGIAVAFFCFVLARDPFTEIFPPVP